MSTTPPAGSVPMDTEPSTTMSATTGPVSLESPLRTTPIHASLPSIKVPADAISTNPNINPITLQPFTQAELTKYGFEKLRTQILASGEGEAQQQQIGGTRKDKDAVGNNRVLSEKAEAELDRLKEETANMLKNKLEERENKTREIEREMDEKEKIREVERKVFRKKLGAAKDG